MALKAIEETRLIRAGVYVEMDLYDAANKAAAQHGLSLSSWARGVLLTNLILSGHITEKSLAKLVGSSPNGNKAA